MKRILITGGAGFIGSHIAEYFSAKSGCDVHVLDNFRTGRRSNLDGLRVRLHEGSINDPDVVRRHMEGMDAVFHLAAFISVPESMLQPDECVRINTLGTLNVVRAAVDAGVRRLVFSSTSAVYGDAQTGPLVETLAPAPQSPYAVTKLDGEHYLRMFAGAASIRWSVLRYFNVFGPRQDPGSAYAAVIPLFISRALRNEDLVIYGDGGQTRDFVYVKDVAAANVWAAEQGGGVYNVGTGMGISVRQLAEDVIRLTGSSARIVHAEPRPGDIRHSRADISRLRDAGFSPAHDRVQGLRETIAAIRPP